MSESVIQIRDRITVDFEGPEPGHDPFAGQSPFRADGTKPFYYEDGKLNFGYGYNLTGNRGSWLQDLSSLGLSANTEILITTFLNTAHPTEKQLNALNDSLPQIDWRPDALAIVDDHYTNAVLPPLTAALAADGVTLDTLPDYVQAALEDVCYRWSGRGIAHFVVPIYANALLHQDWSQLAYNIAFRSASVSGPGIYARDLADAVTALGYTVTLHDNNTIKSLSGPTADIPDSIKFLQQLAATATRLNAYAGAHEGNTHFLAGLVGALGSFGYAHGFAVVEPVLDGRPADTLASIAAAVAAQNLPGLAAFSAAQLSELNTTLGVTPNGATPGAGTALFTPTAFQAITPGGINPAGLALGQTEVLDTNAAGLYTTSADLLAKLHPGETFDGQLYIPQTGQTIQADQVAALGLQNGTFEVDFKTAKNSEYMGLGLGGRTTCSSWRWQAVRRRSSGWRPASSRRC